MASMRIALVSPYSWTYPGGVTRHIEALAERFHADGHYVRVLAPFVGGVLIDRVRPRRALMLVGFSSAALGALTGATGWMVASGATLWMALMVVRGTMGALSAPLHPAAARAIGNWFPFSERSFANGVVTAAAICGVNARW